MTDHPEHEHPVPPAREFKGGDGWWDAIIAAVLEEFEGPEGDRSRGLGR